MPEDLLAELTEVQDAAQTAASLTRQLLALSRKEVRRPVALDLNMHLRRLEKMLRRVIGEDVRLELDCDDQIGPILIDPSQLDQIVLNLVVNARDAMVSNGTITIATRARVRANDTGTDTPWVELTVADTGSGMTEEVIAHIFEPFFTTKGPEKGTGLGLATVYGIVTQSGGTIEVQTETGDGTVFRLLFPACEEDHEPATISKSGRHVAVGRTGTVLIAEDSKEVRRLGTEALLRAGFTVLAASSGEEALRVAAQHPARIDVLLTDVVMHGMDGFTLAERLRAVRPEVQVLYTSGYSETSRFPEDLPGDAQFLEKPFTGRTLVDAVRKRLPQPKSSSRR